MNPQKLPKLLVRPVPVELFPTLGSTKEAAQYAQAKLPTVPWNELQAVLLVYHNSLLAELNKQPITLTEHD